MKKAWVLIALLAVCLLLSSMPAAAENAEEDEWTVLFYLCGSDLESKYGYATSNLEEITQVYYMDTIMSILDQVERTDERLESNPLANNKVNVLIETGGSKEWHAQSLHMDVDPAALQRWIYRVPMPFEDSASNNPRFELLQSLPLRSMADPETLSDFIRWGTETCPAKKYALVLWDHGDGARTGLFFDELFNRDVMYLYELRDALAGGGAHFETVIIDACLMANLETAWNIREYANWLAASEEDVPGMGTAVNDWLQQLFYYPECDGETLARWVCDSTAVKYARETDERYKSILTWSVTDLSKVDALVDAFDRFFLALDNTLRSRASLSAIYSRSINACAEYGDGYQHMRDLGTLFYNSEVSDTMEREQRNGAVQALKDAVVYCVRGPGRAEARGLTFCFPMQLDDDGMDKYAKNFPLPSYLAYLDAVTDWAAPDWVYESIEPLPGVDEIPDLQITVEKALASDGMPGIHLPNVTDLKSVDVMLYRLYRLDEATGDLVCLGETDCILDGKMLEDLQVTYKAADPAHWPAIRGEFLHMSLIQVHGNMKLYNVPVTLNSKTSILRLGRNVNYEEDPHERVNDYEIYGLWEGYDANAEMLNRSVTPLTELAGQEFTPLYPVVRADTQEDSGFTSGTPMKFLRYLEVEEIPLTPGTYYLQYELDDLFLRSTVFDRIEFQWDGHRMTFPDLDKWADGVQINLSELRSGKTAE